MSAPRIVAPLSLLAVALAAVGVGDEPWLAERLPPLPPGPPERGRKLRELMDRVGPPPSSLLAASGPFVEPAPHVEWKGRSKGTRRARKAQRPRGR